MAETVVDICVCVTEFVKSIALAYTKNVSIFTRCGLFISFVLFIQKCIKRVLVRPSAHCRHHLLFESLSITHT